LRKTKNPQPLNRTLELNDIPIKIFFSPLASEGIKPRDSSFESSTISSQNISNQKIEILKFDSPFESHNINIINKDCDTHSDAQSTKLKSKQSNVNKDCNIQSTKNNPNKKIKNFKNLKAVSFDFPFKSLNIINKDCDAHSDAQSTKLQSQKSNVNKDCNVQSTKKRIQTKNKKI